VTGTIQGAAARVAATTCENGVRQRSSPSKLAVMIQAAARSRRANGDGLFSGISEDPEGGEDDDDSDTTTIDYHADRLAEKCVCTNPGANVATPKAEMSNRRRRRCRSPTAASFNRPLLSVAALGELI
jgi:hypothetical protein